MTIRLKQRVAARRRMASALGVRTEKLKQNLERFQQIRTGTAQRASSTPPPPPAFAGLGGLAHSSGAGPARSAPVGEILPPDRSAGTAPVQNKINGIAQQLRSELTQMEQEEKKDIAGVAADYRRIFQEEQQIAMQAASEAQKLSEQAVADVQKREKEIAAETVQRMQSLQQRTEAMLSRAVRGRGTIGQPVGTIPATPAAPAPAEAGRG
jgi:hypothetical protein